MKTLLYRTFAWLAGLFKAEDGRPPYPFDDEEGVEMWNAGKAEVKEEQAVDEQIAEWQRWTSAPRQ